MAEDPISPLSSSGRTPDSLALAWRKRATQSEMEMEELMAGLRKVSADDLKTEGYHDLTPEQQAVVDDFAREMQEVVIPRIVESQRERARIAAEARHRVLFT